MQRKIIAILMTLALGLTLLTGCTPPAETPENDKLTIVATLFPQYDFARRLAGDLADVTLLLPPGVESHSYEPTPADIIAISRADLFVYTGEFMEPWANSILDGVNSDVSILDMSQNIVLDQEDHGDEDAVEHAEHGGYDPHIWTSPRNAMIMVDSLAAALSTADPENATAYGKNAEAYKEELQALDSALTAVVSTAKRNEIVFGGRFALHYFARDYGLTYTSAFDSCSSETEPSARVVARIIDTIKAEQIPVIFYEELTDPKVARSIAEETGAKLLLLHSCHNVSKDELQSGATYLSLMRQNAENLKAGLN